jgi:hypothetical protein
MENFKNARLKGGWVEYIERLTNCYKYYIFHLLFPDLILHEYGGWEHYPNHTEEINILKRYTEVSKFVILK